MRSVAFPLHNSAGQVIAAVNASTHVARVPLERLHEEFIPALAECARAIDADLAGRRQ